MIKGICVPSSIIRRKRFCIRAFSYCFTLLELILVMAVIIIITAILMPALFLISGTTANLLCAAAVTLTACYFSFTVSERKNLLGKKQY